MLLLLASWFIYLWRVYHGIRRQLVVKVPEKVSVDRGIKLFEFNHFFQAFDLVSLHRVLVFQTFNSTLKLLNYLQERRLWLLLLLHESFHTIYEAHFLLFKLSLHLQGEFLFKDARLLGLRSDRLEVALSEWSVGPVLRHEKWIILSAPSTWLHFYLVLCLLRWIWGSWLRAL